MVLFHPLPFWIETSFFLSGIASFEKCAEYAKCARSVHGLAPQWLLKCMYDLMQAVHHKTLSCSGIGKGRKESGDRFKRLSDAFDAAGEK
jgi:hypothetical protein